MEAIIALLILGAVIGLYLAPAIMASNRGRNPLGWLLIGLMFTPVLAIVLLLVLPQEPTSHASN